MLCIGSSWIIYQHSLYYQSFLVITIRVRDKGIAYTYMHSLHCACVFFIYLNTYIHHYTRMIMTIHERERTTRVCPSFIFYGGWCAFNFNNNCSKQNWQCQLTNNNKTACKRRWIFVVRNSDIHVNYLHNNVREMRWSFYIIPAFVLYSTKNDKEWSFYINFSITYFIYICVYCRLYMRACN